MKIDMRKSGEYNEDNDLFFWISSLRTQSKNYKYLELEEINHFDDQRHLQNLKMTLIVEMINLL